ncbi:zinc-ribbon domain-containing protein [Microbacterium enclense]|uniref:zinc-ribbon domain-containing protein n=1 Tax=Microbacterium enclense TaxID=993073 RepID=UPI003F7F968E
MGKPISETDPKVAVWWHPSRNEGLTPDDVSRGSHRKVWWLCDSGHEWDSTIKGRTSMRTGCPVCSGRRTVAGINDLESLRPDIATQWGSGNKLLPSEVTLHSSRKVTWVCAQGHEWIASVRDRTLGLGCPVCAGVRVEPGFNDLPTTHPDLAAEWSPENIVPATSVSRGSDKKFLWRCPSGHDYRAAVSRRTSGRGCPVCSGRSVRAGVNDLATVRPGVARLWSPENALSATEVTQFSHTVVEWRCEIGHGWRSAVSLAVRAADAGTAGCPTCAGKRTLIGFNDLASQNPALAAEWSPNNAIQPTSITVSSGKRIQWVCSRGHEWTTTVDNRTKGLGCPVCSGKSVLAGFNDLATVRPDLAAQWSPKNTLLPTEVTKYANKRVAWVCPNGHEWRALIGNRTSGTGCPHCTGIHVSRAEEELVSALRAAFPTVKGHVRLKAPGAYKRAGYARVDAFGEIQGSPTVVEFDGGYWHANARSLQRDERKTLALLDAGFKVIRVRERPLEPLPIKRHRLIQLSVPPVRGTDRGRREAAAAIVDQIALLPS